MPGSNLVTVISYCKPFMFIKPPLPFLLCDRWEVPGKRKISYPFCQLFILEDHACLCFNKAPEQILSRLHDHRKHFGFFCMILTEFVSMNQMQEGFSSVVGFVHPFSEPDGFQKAIHQKIKYVKLLF